MLQVTSLQARYNGGMLGYFLSGAPAQHARHRYPVLRARMNQFLEEIGCLPILPPEPLDPEAAARLVQEALFAVRMASEEAFDFAFLTSLAFQHVIQRGVMPDLAEQCGALARERLVARGLSVDCLDAFAAAVVPAEDGFIAADPLHSAGLVFLRSLIDPLEVCDRTAFTAMPFAAPHDAYFASFYTPLLARLELCAIRAWGGLSHENYQPMVHTLIAKSGWVLADLTTLNVNVIHEVGMAEGMGRPVFLIAARGEVIPPSNLADLAIVRYARGEAGWEERAIRECAAVLALARLGLEREAAGTG